MQQTRDPATRHLDYASPTPKGATDWVRRLCAALLVVLAFMCVMSAIASLIARQDVLLSVRGDDRWEVTKAVARDMSFAIFLGVIARMLWRRSRG
jgi:hypothetical protein